MIMDRAQLLHIMLNKLKVVPREFRDIIFKKEGTAYYFVEDLLK